MQESNQKPVLFRKINNKFMFMLGILLSTIILIGFLIIYFQNQVLENQFLNTIIETEKDFIDIKEESIRALSTTLEVILQDEIMKQIYLEKDREKLFEYGKPLFQELKEKYQITHFYFIEPDGTSFVRLHNKDIFGDEIKQAIFLKAKETKEVSANFELGKTAYALRVVMPYYNNGELIGYIGLGQEISEFLKIMKKGKTNEFLLAVEKESLNEEDWKSIKEVKGLRYNWEDLQEHVIISTTTDEFFPCFSDDNVHVLREETSLFGKSGLNDKTFICGGFALIDVSNKKSGAIFSLIDVTREQIIIYNIRYILITILFIIALVFIGINFYVSRKISGPIKKLTLATEEIKKRNFKTRVNIKTNDELELLGDSFNQTAQALENMDEDYKQLEKAKTEFLSITSHELRSPMTPMQAQLQMLIEEYYGKLNTRQKESLDIVARNTKRLDRIIVDFLEISRIEAARLKFRFLKKDLTPYIQRLVKEMQGFMPEKKIKIITKLGKLPVINIDPDRVMQVLRNLINNAIKFSKEGKTITVSAKLKGGMIEFSVADQGIGIKPAEQKRIFEPFYQTEQTMYREYQGTGLGLTIIKGIVESQNGSVWLESEVGKGTTFYFTVPLKPVLKIKPIKLLFSAKESLNKKIKAVFIEVLGPMGAQEFENLKRKNQLNEKDLFEYVRILIKKGILSIERGEVLKNRISSILIGKSDKLGVSELAKKGLIKKGGKING